MAGCSKQFDFVFDGGLQSYTRASLINEVIKYLLYERNQIPLHFDILKQQMIVNEARNSQVNGYLDSYQHNFICMINQEWRAYLLELCILYDSVRAVAQLLLLAVAASLERKFSSSGSNGLTGYLSASRAVKAKHCTLEDMTCHVPVEVWTENQTSCQNRKERDCSFQWCELFCIKPFL